MAEYVRYVNTGSTAGGDGTTNATSGANRAYASMSEMEAAEQVNLDVANNVLRVKCAGTSADTTAAVFAGWTTSSTDKLIVEGNSGDAAGANPGYYSTSYYRLDVTNNHALNIQVDYCQFDKFLIQVAETGTANPRIAVLVDSQAAGSRVSLTSMIIKMGTSTGGTVHGIRANDVDLTLSIVNCVLHDFRQGSSRAVDIQTNGGTVRGLNTGIYNCATGWRCSQNASPVRDMTVINCWVQACDSNAGFSLAAGSWGTGTDYNISDSTTDAPGTNKKVSTAISFVSTASKDFHLASGDTAAKGWGTDLSADSIFPFSTDIDGETRTGQWDAGPDQYVSAGGGGGPFPFFTRRTLIGGMSALG